MSYPNVSQLEIPSQGMINYHVYHRISQSCLTARGRPFAIANTTIMTSSDIPTSALKYVGGAHLSIHPP